MDAKNGNPMVLKFLDLIEKKGLTVPAIAEILEIPKDRIYKWKQQGTNPKAEDERKIIEWMGSVEMDKHPQETYQKNRWARKLGGKPKGFPVYESSPATLSNIESYRDTPQGEPDFWVSIPQFRNCDYGCRAKGDSMHPIVRNHAIVGGRQITDLSVIIFGDIYIVHTKNGIETIKYIHPDKENPDKLLLVPYNGNAQTTPILKSDILRLYQAEFVFNPL